jgi:hypothetical protein
MTWCHWRRSAFRHIKGAATIWNIRSTSSPPPASADKPSENGELQFYGYGHAETVTADRRVVGHW